MLVFVVYRKVYHFIGLILIFYIKVNALRAKYLFVSIDINALWAIGSCIYFQLYLFSTQP